MNTQTAKDETLSIDQLVALRPVVLPDRQQPPQWSPDGEQIVFISNLKGEPNLWGISPAGGFPTQLTVGIGDRRFMNSRNVCWSPDGQWMAYISDRDGTARVWLWPAKGGVSRELVDLGANINALSWSPDSQALALSANRYGRYDIYRVELPGGATTRLTRDSLYEVYPVFTPDGEQIVYVRMDERWMDHDVIAMPAEGGEGRVIVRDTDLFDYFYGQTFGYPLVSPDGSTLLFPSYRSGFINYWQVPMEGGEPTPLSAEAADQSEAAWSPDGRSVAYISNQDGTLELRLVSADGGAAQTLVAPQMGVCASPQWSPNGSQISYLYQTPTRPIDLWVVSVESGETRPLTDSMLAGEVARQLVAPQKVVYESFDGLPIHAYLYKPAAVQAGDKLPGILWIHGGPSSQWLDTFHPNVQYFVGQGYVVLMPNIRGSTGYGKAFEDLNRGDYGGGDLKDAVAGADYLKTLDYVNPNQMAITGTSYGGNLSMAAVCFAPDVFQAAIPASGYGSQFDRMGTGGEDEQELRHRKHLEFQIGPFETSQEVFHKCSPIYWAHQATTPTFVLHGEGGRPRSNASLDFVKALEREYKTVQYKTYPNEGYYVRSPANTRQMWLDMLDFLKRYLVD
jgi:dipeptidyl aminopeptidase/acylaminoacyl peptidase